MIPVGSSELDEFNAMMDSVAELFNMGGYALYVWGSFGVTALLMIAEPLLVRARRKAVLKAYFPSVYESKQRKEHESQT